MRHRAPVEADHEPGGGILRDGEPPLAQLDRFGGQGDRFGDVLPGDFSEIPPDQAFSLVGLKVADKHQDGVVGRVVEPVIVHDVLAGQVLEIRSPADDIPLVRMGHVGRRQEVLEQDGFRLGLGGLPAFLQHDIALGMEFPEERLPHPGRLEIRPRLEAVGRKVFHVMRPVEAGVGAQPGEAHLERRHVQVVLDGHQFLARREPLDLEEEHLDSVIHVRGRAAQYFQPAKPEHLVEQLVLLFHQREFQLVVHRLDLLGALEHHVLEHVRDSGDAVGFVAGAHLVTDQRVGDRGLVARHQDDLQPVLQSEGLHGNVDQVRRGGQGQARGNQTGKQEQSSHEVLPTPFFLIIRKCVVRPVSFSRTVPRNQKIGG